MAEAGDLFPGFRLLTKGTQGVNTSVGYLILIMDGANR